MLTIVALLLTFYFSAKTLLLCGSAVKLSSHSPQSRREAEFSQSWFNNFKNDTAHHQIHFLAVQDCNSVFPGH